MHYVYIVYIAYSYKEENQDLNTRMVQAYACEKQEP